MKKFTTAEDLVNFLNVDIEAVREVTAEIVLSRGAKEMEMGDILFNSRNCLAQLESALAYAEELLKIQEKLEQREGRE